MFKKFTALLLAFALVFIMQTPGFANEKAENESLKELFSAYLKTSVSLENDGYIGTLELIQDMEFAKEYFKQN